MTRTLHLVSSADRRGAQVFAVQLAAALGGPPDHRVAAVEPASTDGALPVVLLGRRRWDPAGYVRLVAGLRHFDVLVAHGSSALLHGAAAATQARRPFVYRSIGDPSQWGRVRLSQLRIGAPLRRAAAVVALFPEAADHLRQAYRLAPNAVTVIPNAVEPMPSPNVRSELTVSDRSLRWCGFLGALSPEKGVLDAIRAVASDDGLGLMIAGTGPQDDHARQLADEIAPGRVAFIGVVADPATLLSTVEVILMPSRTEGVPATAIEAGLAGIPVVATRVGGVPSVVVNDVTGVLVDSVDPLELARGIRRALDHRADLGTAATAHCRAHFTMASVSQQWADLLDRSAIGPGEI